MSATGPTALVLRFAAGTLVGLALSFAAFRGQIFQLGRPEFQCVSVGLLLALILAIVRSGRPGKAMLVAVGFGSLQVGLNWGAGYPRFATATIVAVLIAASLVLVSVIFDLLSERGVWFGKFLVLGPLLGGVYLAVTPLSGWGVLSAVELFENFLNNMLLGIVIGDGVGLGVELVELLPALAAGRLPSASPGDGIPESSPPAGPVGGGA